MGSVKSIVTANFIIRILAFNNPVTVQVEIKPTTKNSKDLFRFKKWGKVQNMTLNCNGLFDVADDYETKLAQLAAI